MILHRISAVEWAHSVHPLEEFKILYGRPEVHTDTMEAGTAPIYDISDTSLDYLTVVDGRLEVALPSSGRQGSNNHFVWTGFSPSMSEPVLVDILNRAGCSYIQIVRVKISGGVGALGYRPRDSHAKCAECGVSAVMQM